MAVIKIPKVGDEATFKVAKCEVVESQTVKNKDGTPQEQVKFTAANGDTLFIGRDAADRGLARLGFADGEQVFYGDVDGWTLRFYRVANKNPVFAPYWNIDKVTDEAHEQPEVKTSAKPAPASAPAVAPASEGRVRLDCIDRAYAHAFQIAVKVQGDSATADSLQAGAATLLIAYGQNHLVGLFAPEAPAPAPAKTESRPIKKAAPPPLDDDPGPMEPDEDDLPF